MKRVAIVTAQLLGYDKTGGVGTATSFLAVALAKAGHAVDVVYVGPRVAEPIDPEWERLYGEAGAGVRTLPQSTRVVHPRIMRRPREIEVALRAEPPDVVIAHEFGAPAYGALRLRQLGLAFEQTLFIVFCHGTRLWVKQVNANPRVFTDVIGENVLERACLELADAVVSPSAFLIEWMRSQGWLLPSAVHVIPYLTRSGATGEPPPETAQNGEHTVERVAFFGRVEERKGVRPFIEGINTLPPELLRGLELEFIGKSTKYWTPERVKGRLSADVRSALRRISFETNLDQDEALVRLSRPGTLAVMPSLEDNSPNVVYECLERRIPFLASGAGGTHELVAAEDRQRVLFEPTPQGVETALRRALEGDDALRPARPAFDAEESLRAWQDIIARRPEPTPAPAEHPMVDAIVPEDERDAVAAQSYSFVRPIVASDRVAGLRAADAPWVLFADGQDDLSPELVETLVRTQAASGADIVSCGLEVDGEEHLFAGEPGALGVLENGYGRVALIRRTLLDDAAELWPATTDPDWPLLAQLHLKGARIVSIPLPLAGSTSRPGTLEHDAGDALLVVEHFERALPRHLRPLARLAAGLAADAHRRSQTP
jgi:glycosyltransferase involved in cell wall biosynthesis